MIFLNRKTPRKLKELLERAAKELEKTIMLRLRNLNVRMNHGEAEKFSITLSSREQQMS
jgi:hypothetical protein